MEPDHVVGCFIIGVLHSVIKSPGFQAYRKNGVLFIFFENQSFFKIIMY